MTDEELIARLRKFGELWPDDAVAADRIEALRAEVRKSAMDAVSAGCQAQEAWEAQKAAKAERDALISQHAVMMMERDAARFDVEAAEAQIAALTALIDARAEQLAATNKRLEAALKRVLRNVDEDGVGTVLMIDLIHARAALKGADHE